MTRPVPAAAPPHLGGTVPATALLVAAGVGAWSRLLSGSLLRVAPLTALALLIGGTAALAAGRLSVRLASGLLVVWLPVGLLAAGAPASQLLPSAWPMVLSRLSAGVRLLTTAHSGPTADRSWSLAGWLLGAGVVWFAGAALRASKLSSTPWRVVSFGVLAAPWIAAVLLGSAGGGQTDRAAAWHGAAILLAGLLWFTSRRVALRSALALGLVATLVSVGTTQAVGPRTRWFTSVSLAGSKRPFQTLQTEPSYGPLQGRRSGATMLEVTAEPALWRMRVLTLFFGPGWRIGYPPELPEPAAQPVEVKVEVRGLRDDLVVTPGQITAVHGDGTSRQAPGEAWQLVPAPRQGDTYQVWANVVHATTEQLQSAPAPTNGACRVGRRADSGVVAAGG